MISGILLGRILSRLSWVQFSNRLIFPIVLLLLFLMGISIGNNEEVISNLHILGKDALIITAGALIGTLTGAALLAHYLFHKKEQRR